MKRFVIFLYNLYIRWVQRYDNVRFSPETMGDLHYSVITSTVVKLVLLVVVLSIAFSSFGLSVTYYYYDNKSGLPDGFTDLEICKIYSIDEYTTGKLCNKPYDYLNSRVTLYILFGFVMLVVSFIVFFSWKGSVEKTTDYLLRYIHFSERLEKGF